MYAQRKGLAHSPELNHDLYILGLQTFRRRNKCGYLCEVPGIFPQCEISWKSVRFSSCYMRRSWGQADWTKLIEWYLWFLTLNLPNYNCGVWCGSKGCSQDRQSCWTGTALTSFISFGDDNQLITNSEILEFFITHLFFPNMDGMKKQNKMQSCCKLDQFFLSPSWFASLSA